MKSEFEGSKSYVPAAGDNGTFVEVIKAPAGHHVRITYLLMVASGAVTVDGKWVHNGTDVTFLSAKNMSAGDQVEFGGEPGKFLILTDEDTLEIKASAANLSVICSYVLYPHEGSNIDL